MSHPDSSHDRDNEYPSDNYKPVNARTAAIKSKAFGGSYNRKANKRQLAKGKKHAIKHF